MSAGQSPVPLPVEALRHEIEAGFPAAVEELSRLVAIPGIAWAAYDSAELERSATLVAELLADAGLPDVRILRGTTPAGISGGPAVVARKPAREGWPTVLLYAHHDVQPPGDPGLWDSPPFEAAERGGRLYGRGVADDKAGVAMHLAAVRAVLAVLGPDLGLGITVFVEGEEESGSPTLAALLAEHAELLAADVVVVADSGNWAVGEPALTTSLRGLVDGIIEVRALTHGLHSGTYGGPVLDALTLLGRLLATLHDDDGVVAVEGLAGSADTEVDLAEEQFRRDASVPEGIRLAGRGSLTSRLWSQPALAIIGVDGPGLPSAGTSSGMHPSAPRCASCRGP